MHSVEFENKIIFLDLLVYPSQLGFTCKFSPERGKVAEDVLNFRPYD